MVALMCDCCCKKTSFYFEYLVSSRFSIYYEIDSFGNYIVECFLSAPSYYRFFVSQANYNVGEGFVSPPLDNPDNGNWTAGFFNFHRGHFYKTALAPDLSVIFDDLFRFYGSLSSYDYGGSVVSYFVSKVLNPSDFLFESFSFNSSFDFFRSRVISVFSDCASGSISNNISFDYILGVKVSKNANI